jgi:anti-anti-sigma factor
LLRHALADLIEGQGNRHLAVDMSELAFIDSSGLYVLVDAYRRVTGAGGSFVLWDPRPSILRVLEVTGIGPMLAVEATDAREGATG